MRRRRALAAAGAVSAGLLALSACDKPTPMATITVGTSTVSAEATCGGEGETLKTADLSKCLKAKDIESIKVDPDATVRFGVDPEIADEGWTILMNGQPLTDSSKKTYRTIPGSVFFNAQYGASGDSTLVSIKAGEKDVTGLWSFKLKKDS
ncbi:putative Lipoprotein [Streptomyces viridochromogenes Tue57]|uniref:Putative Lipoprotein n=1 Tax=Streptomyces viridochromogenes Tue57 TaxID=1160705 RepID=L8PCN6_STRVR|nr:putative Lipoprotein [Streptomyces viridochromogenes Tue57]